MRIDVLLIFLTYQFAAVGSSNGVTIPDSVNTVVCAPDDGWKYHPKRVE
jgi:hypothetical protein